MTFEIQRLTDDHGDYLVVTFPDGQYFSIDVEDECWLQKVPRIYHIPNSGGSYAFCRMQAPSRTVGMHRLIMGCPKDTVDHINGDRLNNRRHNLRVLTQAAIGLRGRLALLNFPHEHEPLTDEIIAYESTRVSAMMDARFGPVATNAPK